MCEMSLVTLSTEPSDQMLNDHQHSGKKDDGMKNAGWQATNVLLIV